LLEPTALFSMKLLLVNSSLAPVARYTAPPWLVELFPWKMLFKKSALVVVA